MEEKDLLEAIIPLFGSINMRLDVIEARINNIEINVKNIKDTVKDTEKRIDFMETDVKDTKYKAVNILNDLLSISSDTRKTKLIIENEIKPVFQVMQTMQALKEVHTENIEK